MKALNSIILIFLTVQLFGQGIAHYQIKEPQAEKGDSFLTFIRDGDYYRFGTATIDTSDINFLNEYFNIRADVGWEKVKDTLAFYLIENNLTAYKLTDFDSAGFRVNISQVDGYVDPDLSDYATLFDVGDTANVIRSQIPDYETDPIFTDWDKSTGISITESQISDLQDYLTNSDLSGLRDSTLANTGKDTTGIYHANRALLDAIDVNDTTRWGEQPEFLTDLDSTDFDIDTTQVRNLKTFVENNSGEASISGTAGYIPKFGVSGLTESGVYEDGSGNVGIGTTTPSAKLEVNGNIKADTIKAVLDTIYADKTSWSEFVGGSDLWTDDGTTLTATRGRVVVPFLNYGSYIQLTDHSNSLDNLVLSIGASYNSISNSKLAGFIIQKGNNPRVGYQGTYGKKQMLFPYADGTSGQVLTTNGSGNMYWSDGGGGGSGDITGVLTYPYSMITGGGTSGDVTLVFDIDNAYAASSVSSLDYMPISRNGNEEKVRLNTLKSFFGGGGSMVYPSSTGLAYYNSSTGTWGTSITDNSNNWNTAYTDRMKWDGGSTGLNATTGRSSLGLGSMATKNFWSGTQTQYDNLSSYDSNTIYFIED